MTGWQPSTNFEIEQLAFQAHAHVETVERMRRKYPDDTWEQMAARLKALEGGEER